MLCNKSELQWTLPFWRNHYFQWRCGIPRKKWGKSHQLDGKRPWKSGMHKRTVVYFPPQTDAQWYFQPTGMRRTGKDRRGWKYCPGRMYFYGIHRGALETKGSYPAIISCVLTNGAMPHITNTLIQEDIIFSARPKMWWVLLRLILSGAFVPYRH